ncbi:endonuclease/exonuclease/phosphatase family protein [Thalassotalea marina]|uniref:Endonuclease/exonuclease/phosphatase domain-containing protein n=1 Tax=Thalassotalea marina TaxID=1673741 RepID=A0A919BQW0_9GAMM|nr:endonuclease/exonuclease/phosphatase family protein [Thalassotalea marina]GHG08471.1 hypothetical protein GCM10017161_42820 [Thalassotalea marina]
MRNLIPLTSAVFFMASQSALATDHIRIATFNVSMEAKNYVQGKDTELTGNELQQALNNQEQQIKNIAEIIQRVNPDIILLNEFDNLNNGNSAALKQFIKQYLNKAQQGQNPIDFPYFYQGPVNTGVLMPVDINGDNKITPPQDTFGFGYFPGHYSMALLSKYPIDIKSIRTFQQFKWQDMPNALKPKLPDTGESYYNENVWQAMRLSSKSHWDIPVSINGQRIHVLASHPTPPVFDGPEDRNGSRNHDEIRFWVDYISPEQSHYIYDDQHNKGGLDRNSRFVVLGDLNASVDDGDANKEGIGLLLNHPNVRDSKPTSKGGKTHSADNANGASHTAFWRMRADYVLPSKFGLEVVNSGVFWPESSDSLFRLIDSRASSSDHRLVWIDVKLTDKNK